MNDDEILAKIRKIYSSMSVGEIGWAFSEYAESAGYTYKEGPKRFTTKESDDGKAIRCQLYEPETTDTVAFEMMVRTWGMGEIHFIYNNKTILTDKGKMIQCGDVEGLRSAIKAYPNLFAKFGIEEE